jgi:hypothetical protein
MSVRDGQRLGVSRNVRPSAHEWYFAAAAEYLLAVLTNGERNATFSHFSICQCVRYVLCRVGCCVGSSAMNQGTEKKGVLGTSTSSGRHFL